MKFKIICVGKLRKGPIVELAQEYLQRCKWSIQLIEIDHTDKETEGRMILSHVGDVEHVILLDENGVSLTSTGFADYLDKLGVSGVSKITFIIGGAYGLAPVLKSKAQKVIAFGNQTWPHQFVRIMLIEQLYRAQQILSGHPYHKS
jgi:23S rRNA (pseudouridine1915-N3)-methyltransferase